jgi:hypothetical protein
LDVNDAAAGMEQIQQTQYHHLMASLEAVELLEAGAVEVVDTPQR